MTFILHAPLFSIRSFFFYLIPNYGEKDGYYPSLWMIQLTLDLPIQSLILYKFLHKHYKKARKKFVCCATPKKKAAQLTTAQDNVKSAEG